MLFGKELTLRRDKSWLIEFSTESILTKHALLQFTALSSCLWTCNAEYALIDNDDVSAWHDCYDTVTLLAHKYYSIKIFGSYSILKQLKWFH